MIAAVIALSPILFGAALAAITCAALGSLILHILNVRLYREEHWPVAFVAGGAALSGIVFALGCLHLIYPPVLIGISLLCLLSNRWVPGAARERLPALPAYLTTLFVIGFGIYNLLYVRYALAPEMSPDGMAYHLGLVNLYYNAHGLIRITTNMYASLSQGMEMLFLFAFAFGRHSAAALVHYLFLICLPLLMLTYAMRFGIPAAGVFGALLVFASPVMGIDGTSAYIDVGLACVGFATFYALSIWEEQRESGVLILAGILSGFAFAIKYTGAFVLAGALVFVFWRSTNKRRSAAIVLASAAPLMLIWLVKNWLWVDNPIAPFANAIFPNPYVHVSFEREYTYLLSHWNGVRAWQIPVEITILGGRLGGLIGPVFLAAPVALFALRTKQGRRLIAAAVVVGAAYLFNHGTRFIIPVLPFIALAMGIECVRHGMLCLIAAANLILCWPTVVNRYCAPDAWRLSHIPWIDVLRIESQDDYLRHWSEDYRADRMIDRAVPGAEQVFAFGGVAQAYTSHPVLVSFQAAFNQRIRYMLCAGFQPEDCQPLLTQRFSFPLANPRRLRIVQLGAGKTDLWSIGEIHLANSSTPLPVDPKWVVNASPNPWDARLAVDGSPVTRWSSWEIVRPGMFFEIDLGGPHRIDTVLLDIPGAQWESRLRLDGSADGRRWVTLSDKPALERAPPMKDYRRLAALEAKRLGVRYILVKKSDYEWKDFQNHRSQWGVTPIASDSDCTVYRID
ncbi:MAG: discoidin domain-containing protein [Acidobacteriota bacterium]|nr:discoidin domain-containing protein [Acidobacteriota bacterium]